MIIYDVLEQIEYPGWGWRVSSEGNGWLIQGQFIRPDRDSEEMGVGLSRQEYLPNDATADQIVKTAWVLIKLTIEHEAMEWFLYRGKRVFDPHIPVEALISLQKEAE